MVKTIRLLIIEDMEDDAFLILRELRKGGFEPDYTIVDTKKDMEKALTAQTWDIIVSDYFLPRFNGLEALEIAKNYDPDIPFILVSGAIGEDLAVAAMKAGAQDYMMKDNLKRLIPAVKRELHDAQVRIAHRKSESDLEDSKNMLQSIIDNAAAVIYLKDSQGNYILINKQYETLFHTNNEQIKGKNDYDIFPENVAAVLRNNDRKVIEANRAMEFEEVIHHDGDPHTYISVKFPICDASGVLTSVCSICTDITERKKLEARFQQAQKMEAIGTLTGGIAHDFNNLLAVIIGNTELLEEQIQKGHYKADHLVEIKSAGQRAANLVHQLLAFSRRQVIKPKLINFNDILKDLEKMLGRIIGEDILLKIFPATGLWPVNIDPGQVDQVIMNIAVNARDAMPSGGNLNIETKNIELKAGHFRDHDVENPPGPYVMLTISDTGIGMDAETRKRAFEPFFTTKETGKGTGLGLSTVYGIVKQNGGYIWAYSEPGYGTTIKIYLPKGKEDTAEFQRTEPVEGSLEGSETILVVEDDPSLRRLSRKIFEKYGYKVLEAKNGAEALRIAREYEGAIQLVLTDVIMPEMNGAELVKHLMRIQPDLKYIYMSGYPENTLSNSGLSNSNFDLIEKPFSTDTLVGKVRKVLDKAKDKKQ
jgi:two-component system, cell cycle sensor histidine kinase and response regulator CckA